MSNEEREFTGNEERDRGNEEPDVEAHKRKAFDELVTNHSPSGLKVKYTPSSKAGRFETRT